MAFRWKFNSHFGPVRQIGPRRQLDVISLDDRGDAHGLNLGYPKAGINENEAHRSPRLPSLASVLHGHLARDFLSNIRRA